MPAACSAAPGKGSLKLPLRGADSQKKLYKLKIDNLQCLNSQMLTVISTLRRGVHNQQPRCAALNVPMPSKPLAYGIPSLICPVLQLQSSQEVAAAEPQQHMLLSSAQLLFAATLCTGFCWQAACQWHSPEGHQNDGKFPERWQLDHLPQLIVGCQHLSRCAILGLLAALLCACTGAAQSAWTSRITRWCLPCSLCHSLGAAWDRADGAV